MNTFCKCIYFYRKNFNSFGTIYKTLRKKENKVLLQTVYSQPNVNYYLKGRSTYRNPYSENSLLVFTDICDGSGNIKTPDFRNRFIKDFNLKSPKESENFLKKTLFSMNLKIYLGDRKETNFEDKLNKIYDLLLKLNIIIDEYMIENQKITLKLTYVPILSFCDDFLVLKWILNKELQTTSSNYEIGIKVINSDVITASDGTDMKFIKKLDSKHELIYGKRLQNLKPKFVSNLNTKFLEFKIKDIQDNFDIYTTMHQLCSIISFNEKLHIQDPGK